MPSTHAARTSGRRESAAEALDRLAAENGQLLTESSPDAEATADAEAVPDTPRRSRAGDDDLHPFEAELVRPDVEHDLEFGLE